ncbi:MAG: ABC transporter ATP-binding protein [Pyrinomonadaceae bacterium]|nr:ABC transporter ATP-binding protein [Phycisphaerales bacterium]
MAQASSSGSGSPVVVCQRLTKVFRDFWKRPRVRAVDDVSFEVQRGEVFGLLGPNGSGKSTAIKIMLGLLHPTSGRVAVLGKPPADVTVKKKIGYLPEESYLYQFLNARETLDYYGKLFQLDRVVRKKRIDELLDMVGLSAVQHRQVREYSKGMQRRIGIAQALINDPEFLILDEPTTGLDPIGSRQIKDLIINLGKRGKTVLLSSHMLADVEDCVDRMAILYGGKIREEGTCDSLLTTEGHQVIETDQLSDATIGRIDQLIRESTGGQSSIIRVFKPRQKLEDLFIGLVEKAIAERVVTSGAMHGGQTATFLQAQSETENQGDALISKLVGAGQRDERPEEMVQPLAANQSRKAAEPDVLRQLLKTDEEADNGPRGEVSNFQSAPGPVVGKDVDLGMIDSLLDDENDDKSGPGQKPGAGRETRP